MRLPEAALAWFGRVDSTANYADSRIGYTAEALVITLHIFDRRLWYSASPPLPGALTAWDAATLYLDLDGSQGDTPSSDSYRFVAQLNHGQPRAAYQAVYQGSGTGWVQSSQPFTTTTVWRGDAPNTEVDDRGWVASFAIPFSSLGLQGPPSPGETWGFGLVVHDRDDLSGSAIPDQTWPETLSPQRPATWGQLRFDPPPYTAPNIPTSDVVTLRQGLNGVQVGDAQVGGGATCGQEHAPSFFEGWGDANDAGARQINIQNQGDVADWPCFSKTYVTFPTGTLPAGKVVISATLTLHLFGNAGYEPGQARPSLIQVHTLADGWEESTITWNNAPLPVENVAATWVEPVTSFPGWPGVPYTWDVSQAVAGAYASGEAVRLALYSADSAYHSGKYFSSSDVEDWNATARPTLTIWLGEP